MRVPTLELIHDSQRRVVRVACAEDEFEVRIVLKKETFEVAFKIGLDPVDRFEHRHRGQLTDMRLNMVARLSKSAPRYKNKNEINGARNETNEGRNDEKPKRREITHFRFVSRYFPPLFFTTCIPVPPASS